jgi:uncharacterized protein (TIGR02145 family)
MKTQIVILLYFISITCFAQEEYIKDIEGNKYQVYEFGNEELMLDNLRSTKYQNGDPIPLILENNDWPKLETGAYCNYKNNEENGKTFGRLYNYFAVTDKRNLCPSGWHVPSIKDWIKLEGYAKAEKGSVVNLYGFLIKENNSGSYGGSRGIKGWFFNIENNGQWWSTTSRNKYTAWYSQLHKTGEYIYTNQKLAVPKYGGLSVRCMRDTSLWAKTALDITIKTLKEYIANYPQGKHAEEAYLILQDRFDIPSPRVLPHFNPSLTGYLNTLFVETDTLVKNGKKMVVFWSNSKTPYTLVAAKGGILYGNKSDIELKPTGEVGVTYSGRAGERWKTKSNVEFEYGPKKELITYGDAHLAIEGETDFQNNLDYEGSTFTFIDTVKLIKNTFISNKQEPLIFILEKERGFVYLKGKGAVITEKGKEFKFK